MIRSLKLDLISEKSIPEMDSIVSKWEKEGLNPRQEIYDAIRLKQEMESHLSLLEILSILSFIEKACQLTGKEKAEIMDPCLDQVISIDWNALHSCFSKREEMIKEEKKEISKQQHEKKIEKREEIKEKIEEEYPIPLDFLAND